MSIARLFAAGLKGDNHDPGFRRVPRRGGDGAAVHGEGAGLRVGVRWLKAGAPGGAEGVAAGESSSRTALRESRWAPQVGVKLKEVPRLDC